MRGEMAIFFWLNNRKIIIPQVSPQRVHRSPKSRMNGRGAVGNWKISCFWSEDMKKKGRGSLPQQMLVAL
jgi:hypothetical protein